MRLILDYGTDGLEVDLPDERVTVIEPVFRPAAADPRATLLAALRAPLQSAPVAGLVRAGQRVAISICDVTRAQPRREMLRALFDELPHVRAEDVTILIATGTHRTNTPAELERMLGSPGYSMPDQWQVQIQAQVQQQADVLVKTTGLTPDQLRAAHFTPVDDVSEAVREALRKAGAAATLCVLPQGPQTIPYLQVEAVEVVERWKS